ncbi:MAG: hypothetical protein EP329_14805, partial [Deltaproteobacteria bacterium]
MSGRWSRALLAITGITAAGLLLAAALTSHAGVEAASELVLRGQVATIVDAVRVRIHGARSRGEDASNEDLDAVVHGFDGAGLRYVSLIGPQGEQIAHSGTPVGGPPDVALDAAQPFGRWTTVGERVRAVIPFGGPPGAGPGHPPRGPLPIGPGAPLPHPTPP